MHRVFGTRENAEYTDRKGAYLIPVRGDMVAVMRTPLGYFLLGGGIEDGESDVTCISRECIEEAGCPAVVKDELCTAETFFHNEKIGYFHPIQTYYTGLLLPPVAAPSEKDHELLWMKYSDIKGKMFWEMQDWALQLVFEK